MRPLSPVGPIALLTFVALAAGCAATSQTMTRGSTGSLPPPAPDRATVIFLRTSAFGASESFVLFDDKKRFLGESLPRAHFEVSLPPGTHWLYASAENTAAMRAELEAGKRYYVSVRPYIGVWGARVELISLARSAQDWPLRARLVSKTERMIAVPRKGEAALRARSAELDEEIRDAGEAWQRASDAWRASHTLFADDGETITRNLATQAPAPAPVFEQAATPVRAEPVPDIVPSAVPIDAPPPIDAAPTATPAGPAAPLPTDAEPAGASAAP